MKFPFDWLVNKTEHKKFPQSVFSCLLWKGNLYAEKDLLQVNTKWLVISRYCPFDIALCRYLYKEMERWRYAHSVWHHLSVSLAALSHNDTNKWENVVVRLECNGWWMTIFILNHIFNKRVCWAFLFIWTMSLPWKISWFEAPFLMWAKINHIREGSICENK